MTRHLTNPAANQLGLWDSHAAETSREAALANYPRSGTQRARVLVALFYSGDAGMTDEELTLMLDLSPSSERPRRVECVEAGWVEDSGARRLTRTRSRAAVWVCTEAGRSAAQQLAA